MITKLIAAELATATGCTTVITIGSNPQLISTLIQNYETFKNTKDECILTNGTYFIAKQRKLDNNKWWIKHGLTSYGKLYLDNGAVESIFKHKKSLFAAGIFKVEGTFSSQQCVTLMSTLEQVGGGKAIEVEVGRGIVNYNCSEIKQLIGSKSSDIQNKLGYIDTEWIIHRDNLVISNESNRFI
jgi:glutamate 5-kinase